MPIVVCEASAPVHRAVAEGDEEQLVRKAYTTCGADRDQIDHGHEVLPPPWASLGLSSRGTADWGEQQQT